MSANSPSGESTKARLHLGCGRYYLDGYTNIDYPATEHTVQAGIKADLYCDIASLEFPASSIEEIRLHHVFEHFSRPTALALMCRWRDWLKAGGILRIETPDLAASVWRLASPFATYKQKQQIIRHLFGSHESHWAVHWDGWYAARFRHTFSKLGFEDLSFQFSKWGALCNVDVTAKKSDSVLHVDQYMAAAKELLQHSLINDTSQQPQKIPVSEEQLLSVWMDGWRSAYLLKQVSKNPTK